MSSESTSTTLESAQNHVDDDLDDLDDLLDKFNEPSPQISSPHQPPTFNRPRTNTRVDAPPKSIPGSRTNLDPTTETNEDVLQEEFARELAKGMEDLMKELTGGRDLSSTSSAATASGVGGGGGDGSDTLELTDEEKAFRAAWEAMLIEGMNANSEQLLDPDLAQPSDESKTLDAGSTSTDFQNTIRQAMGKFKENESNLQQSTSGSTSTPTADSLDSLLKSLGDLGIGDGPEDEEALAGILEDMMGQLMTKEVLYEPLKELADKFPGYLTNPPKPLAHDERERYEKQSTYASQIIEIFEQPAYDDEDPEARKKIVDLMGEMQTYGTPPPEVMGPLPPGLPGLGDGSGGEGCIIA